MESWNTNYFFCIELCDCGDVVVPGLWTRGHNDGYLQTSYWLHHVRSLTQNNFWLMHWWRFDGYNQARRNKIRVERIHVARKLFLSFVIVKSGLQYGQNTVKFPSSIRPKCNFSWRHYLWSDGFDSTSFSHLE